MNGNREHDECLERLWHLREQGGAGTEGPRQDCLDALVREGLVIVDPAGEASFTPQGEERARRLIRCHRIAERLLHDVLGENQESSACEFEHLVETGVVDSICTLLGHPRECPHGFPIPEGDCCRRSAEVVRRRVVPIMDLAIGEAARIAWVYSSTDARLHALESMQIRPGALVRLHQTRPSVVIEVEGASVAIDESVAAAINVWSPEGGDGEEPRPTDLSRGRHRWRGGRG